MLRYCLYKILIIKILIKLSLKRYLKKYTYILNFETK